MSKDNGFENKNKSFSLVRKIGITIIIPIFLAILGVLLILSAGWNYISVGKDLGAILFAKPPVVLERKTYIINDKKIERPVIGDEIAKLKIPSIEIDKSVYQGVTEKQFRLGIGHHTNSTLPGEGGKVILAAHRDGFFAPLQYINEGDEVVVETEYGKYHYKVSKIWITDKDDRNVCEPADHEMLVMYTCYPFNYIGSAPDRYIVECEYIKVEG